jgi:pimeloyl-ACP methyl ester carboxylesterase
VTDVSAGHHVFTCDTIGYDVEISPACAAGGCGLILDMHGFTMNAGSEDKGTNMRVLGPQHGYVVVQPTAPGNPPSWDQPTHIPKVFAFISDVAAALVTDPKRAHSMGFSQGGGMTWRMICAHADFFASAAPLSGLTGCEFTAPNVPSREVPVLQVHGHKDNVLNFATYAIPQRDAALKYWTDGAGAAFQMDATHTATRYLSPGGTPFEFWEHDFSAGSVIIGGHCFPGGSDVGVSPFQFGCADMNTFVVGELAMQFFLDHPMK